MAARRAGPTPLLPQRGPALAIRSARVPPADLRAPLSPHQHLRALALAGHSALTKSRQVALRVTHQSLHHHSARSITRRLPGALPV